MITNGKNSPNCSEEDFNNPFADKYFSHENIYNFCSEEVMNMRKGSHHTEESRKRISKGHKGQIPWCIGKKLSVQHKENISEGHKGQKAWNKGIKMPKEFCDKISGKNNPMYGKTHTLETRLKISKGGKGKIGFWNGKKHSEITKVKMSQARKGKTLSNSAKEKLSKHRKGKNYGMVGSNHPRWLGGISFEPYCPKFNKQLKEQVRERDNRTCQLCGEKENGRKLDVHHIHYDKPNCEPDLIALCQKCNVKANFNRDYYESLFVDILKWRGLF